LPHLGLLTRTVVRDGLRRPRLGLRCRLSAASAVAVAISVVGTAWRGATLSAVLTAALTLRSTTTAVTTLSITALTPAALLCPTLLSAALLSTTTATGPRFAARVSLPLSAFCRAHERSR